MPRRVVPDEPTDVIKNSLQKVTFMAQILPAAAERYQLYQIRRDAAEVAASLVVTRQGLLRGDLNLSVDALTRLHHLAYVNYDQGLYLGTLNALGRLAPPSQNADATSPHDLWRLGDCALENADWAKARWLWQAADRFCGDKSAAQALLNMRLGTHSISPVQRASILFNRHALEDSHPKDLFLSTHSERAMDSILQGATDHPPALMVRAAQHINREENERAHATLSLLIPAAAKYGFTLPPEFLDFDASSPVPASKWKEICNLWPGQPLLAYTRGLLLGNEHQRDEACELTAEVSFLVPDSSLPYELIAQVRTFQAYYLEAETAWTSALLRSEDRPESWLGLGKLQCRRGDMAAADRSFSKYLDLRENTADAKVDLGIALALDRLAPERSAQAFEEVLAAEEATREDVINAHLNLGPTLRILNRTDESIYHIEEAIRIVGEEVRGASMAHRILARSLAQAKRDDEALRAYRRYLHDAPDDIDTLVEVGVWLMKVYRFEEAISTWNSIVSLDSNHAEGLAQIGVCNLFLERPEHAISWLSRSLSVDADNASVHRCMATALRQIGDYETASRHLQQGTPELDDEE